MNTSTLRIEREEEVFYLLVGILILWVISVIRSQNMSNLESEP
ncbi:hypothetical protein SAMN04487995_2614 [Dyadobacter koreensis]|uniref:Uncharacterized protein n=1 Tax=Dyadobacter koreensis TaxID=408657 RepID=A0A1H6UM80_9BACT|nr:hypothetical protein [Dyadobacter koreensis]SEI93398.1 hypothetical protein SAMN04487995_2614 [Dyadobacter koreensis]